MISERCLDEPVFAVDVGERHGQWRFYVGPPIARRIGREGAGMLDVEFAREQYRFELQRKSELLNAVSLPVGVLSALGSLAVLMAKGYSYNSWARIPFGISLSMDVVCFLIATFSLARLYVGPTYAFIPKPGAIASFKAELEGFYVGLGYPPESAEPDFRDQLSRWFVHATDQNMANNDRLSEHLTRARQGLIGVLISMALCGILYLVDVLRAL
jgi:hypothetical protein